MRTDGDSTDNISGVTYGGSALSAVSGGLAQDTSGEPGLCKAYFLGSSVPTGSQTVQVTTTAGSYYCAAITVDSVGNTQAHGVVLLQENGTIVEQSVDDGTPGSPSMRYAAGYSGQKTVPSIGSNSTSLLSASLDTTSVMACRETTAGQGSRSVGFTSATTDDRAFVHLALREVI